MGVLNTTLMEARISELEKVVQQLITKVSGSASHQQLIQLNSLRQSEMDDLKDRMERLESFVRVHAASE